MRVFVFLLCLAFPLFVGIESYATDWHVNPDVGDNENSGSELNPLQTLQAAINKAKDGDVIHLHPAGAVYRQGGVFRSQVGITIEGNGVTLDGSDPLPAVGWEEMGAGLYRRKLRRTPLDRHLLVFDGRMERMGRTQSANSPEFPQVSALKTGQFCFENIDEKWGWLYVRGDVTKLEWSTRVNGIATAGGCQRLVVKNLRARNFLNDGFNVHGDCRNLKFVQIEGFDCFDEGFSAHESAECLISGGKFYGNENGVADVNQAHTAYVDCEFFRNVNVDVLLIGRSHALINCEIRNMTPASALVAGPRGDEHSFVLNLWNVAIQASEDKEAAPVRINGGRIILHRCDFTNVDFNGTGAELVGEVPSVKTP